jgi:A/G-specific adenine glycosylase
VLKQPKNIGEFQVRLLAWFDNEGRDLPWRKRKPRNPFRVWVSEIMLQQTTVKAVIPYFLKFLDLYPNVETLAKAPLENVLKTWAGLGYYSRARNLHKCAGVIVKNFGGRFPKTEQELLELPGIGLYSAAAIAAIAFEEKTVVVDANVERVVARLFRVGAPLPNSKPALRKLAKTLTPGLRPGDYAEAVMDLGALICTPKDPACHQCPVSGLCLAKAAGEQNLLPRREKKQSRPIRLGTVFWLEDKDKVLVRRRPEKGLLGGMPEFPTTPWEKTLQNPKDFTPAEIFWTDLGEVAHTFTHFHLKLRVLKGEGPGGPGQWVMKDEVLDLGLPTVMKKVALRVLGEKEG